MDKPALSRGRRIAGIAACTATVAAAYVVALSGVVLASPAGPSVAGQYPPSKVTICHHANGKKGTKHVTIRVSRSALRAHLRHGDSLGSCTTAKNKKLHKKNKTHARKFHKPAKR